MYLHLIYIKHALYVISTVARSPEYLQFDILLLSGKTRMTGFGVERAGIWIFL